MKVKIIWFTLLLVILLVSVVFFIVNSKQTKTEVGAPSVNTSLPIVEAPALDSLLLPDVSDDLSRELITVPINIFLVHDVNAEYSTRRDEEDIRRVLSEMTLIWSQAEVAFIVKKLQTIEIISTDKASVSELVALVQQDLDYDKEVINIYFTRTLYGSNGIAFPRERVTFVADYTSVNDYRASSHEVGHVLGLSHTDDSIDRLMFRGVNGTDLTPSEIAISRREAIRTFVEDSQL